VADLGDLGAAEAVAEEAWEAFGGLEILVNNAAIPKVRAAVDLTPAEVEEAMRVNFFSPVRMTLRLLPRFLAQGAGTVVNVASMGGRVGVPHEAAYCASKFALCGWSESLAIDLHDTPVMIRLIQPGPIATDIWDRPGQPRAVYDGPKWPADEVAAGIVAALGDDHFEHYLPDLEAVVIDKTNDIDNYLAGAATMLHEGEGS